MPAWPARRTVEISLDVLPGEENARNNAVRRLINVTSDKPRILYMDGRAAAGSTSLSAGRSRKTAACTSPPSCARRRTSSIPQGVDNTDELKDGFPAKVEEIFAYQGIVIGTVESSYFTKAQQELIREFADRRGGGVLFLGGRIALHRRRLRSFRFRRNASGGLHDRKGAFRRDPAKVRAHRRRAR